MSQSNSPKTCNPELSSLLDQIAFKLRLKHTDFNEDYVPLPQTRATTNYSNLARNSHRKTNLRTLFTLINQRLNELIPLCGCAPGKYQIGLRIVSVEASFGNQPYVDLPLTEMLEASVTNQTTGETIEGALGMNFSSYIRDYDFNVVFPSIRAGNATLAQQDEFGLLHGLLYQLQFKDFWCDGVIERETITAISVSTRKRYQRQSTPHPILGHPYSELPPPSPTTHYFNKMGLDSVYYMPTGSTAPFAIYLKDGDIHRFTPVELASLVAVMDTFQRIYRPEIYNRHKPAGEKFQPSLCNTHYQPLNLIYDRDERNVLALAQAKRIEKVFLLPFAPQLRAMMDTYLTFEKTS